RLISRGGRVEWRLHDSRKPTTPVVPINRQLSAPAAADDQILMPVAVHVEPAHAGTKLAQLPGQQRLPFEIIIRLFVMDVSDHFTDIFENRLGGEGGTGRVESD